MLRRDHGPHRCGWPSCCSRLAVPSYISLQHLLVQPPGVKAPRAERSSPRRKLPVQRQPQREDLIQVVRCLRGSFAIFSPLVSHSCTCSIVFSADTAFFALVACRQYPECFAPGSAPNSVLCPKSRKLALHRGQALGHAAALFGFLHTTLTHRESHSQTQLRPAAFEPRNAWRC